MANFSPAAINSACETISHRTISASSELDGLIKSVDPANPCAQRLLALSAELGHFRKAVESLRESIIASPVVSLVVQSGIRASIPPCSDASATIEKEILRLQPGFTVDAIDTNAVSEYEEHQAANAHLFALFAQILQICSLEGQEEAFAHLQGARVVERAVKSSQRVVAGSSVFSSLLASNSPSEDTTEAHGPASPLPPYHPPQDTKGTSKASGGFLASLSDSLRAMTINLRAKPEPMTVAMCQIAKSGNVRHLEGLVAQGVNINGQNEEGYTPLICATRANQVDSIRYLVAAGADLAAKDSHSGQRKPPLFHAAECGHTRAADELINLGANIHEKSWSGQPFFVEVANSDDLGMLKLFLDRGANPNTSGNSGRTIAVHAIQSGSLDRLALLHQYGANIIANDITGQSPLHMALGQDRMDIFDFLLAHGADPNSTDMTGKSLLHAALQRKKYDLVRNLLTRGANPNVNDMMGTSLLATLIDNNTVDDETRSDLVRMALIKGSDPNQPDSWGEPLLCRVMEKGNTELLRAFLKHRANPNLEFRRRGTLLLYALDQGREDQALLLLKHGADPNKPDSNGRRPLLEALQMGAMHVVKELLAVGADVNLAGQVKPLAFAKALGNQELVRLFLARGAENPTRPAASTNGGSNSAGADVSRPLYRTPGAGQDVQGVEDVPPAYAEAQGP